VRFSINKPETKMMENPLIIGYSHLNHHLDPGLSPWEKGERVRREGYICNPPCAGLSFLPAPLPFPLGLETSAPSASCLWAPFPAQAKLGLAFDGYVSLQAKFLETLK
jgi:hypothetical protein